MTTQQIYSADVPVLVEGNMTPIEKYFLSAKMIGLSRGLIIPDAIISEIESFCERNNICTPVESVHTSCPHCLKAYILNKAIKAEMDKRSIDFLLFLFKGSVGHDGYYLDGEDLFNLNYSNVNKKIIN